ncbi:hypothetical protein KSS87_019044 [Heliosperma pusillum]|nr:hypothetical protein KSS87_019044 [Heliosperma pusillum]
MIVIDEEEGAYQAYGYDCVSALTWLRSSLLCLDCIGPNTLDAKKNCDTCRGRGAIDCPGCKGTGRNKKNGNIFERWKCFECQGFGLKSCPGCGKGGLTPEQRGER